MVRDFVFATAVYRSGDWESAPLLPSNLIASVARYTSLPVAPMGVNVELGSPAIFDFPFVWLTGHLPVRFTDQERKNLKQYVERGGFMVIDDHNHDIDGIFHKTMTEELKRTFGPLKEIPKSHEIYHCFFEFQEGPPATGAEVSGWGDQLVHKELHAVMTNGDRIGLVYSLKDYSSEWNMHPDTNIMSNAVDVTRFGVNMIVYALTR